MIEYIKFWIAEALAPLLLFIGIVLAFTLAQFINSLIAKVMNYFMGKK